MSRSYSSSGFWSSSESGGLRTFIIVIVIILLLIYIGYSCSRVSTENTYIATITEKAVKNYSDDSKYLIFTKNEDKEIRVFEITDSWSRGRFNSSDLYGSLEIGKTYEFQVYGLRNEFLSDYENILSAEEVK